MHTMFVAMMLVVGADPGAFVSSQPVIGPQPQTVMAGPPGSFGGVQGPYHYDPPRDPKEDDGLIRGFFTYCKAWFEPMPQTCYTPHFGCYPGNGRDIYRPTAFHGYYYRQAYNYRPLYEYPWQAGMHEPLPFELSSERSMAGGPQLAQPQPQPAEVIDTPSPKPPHPMP